MRQGHLHSDAGINQHLQIAINPSNSFESIYLLNENRVITNLALSESNQGRREDYIGLDMSNHDIFSQAGPLAGHTWFDTFLSTVTAEPSITLGIPTGKGTLIGTVSLQRISNELIDRMGQSNYQFHFSLLDHNGILIRYS